MHATLWRVTGERWDKVEELRISSPPPHEILVPKPYRLKVRDFKQGETMVPEMLEVDRYILWRVWYAGNEAVYVQRVQENEGEGHV